jgi:hypothetical protein
MGRKLMRVPLDFAWPLKKVWKGYINPYAKLSRDCTACEKMGYSPRALQFHQEWYGYVAFDPVAYGATPIGPDHPRIREFATMQVNRHPEHYMTSHERKRERENFQKAGVDLLEIYKTTEELRAELDKPAGDLEELQKEGLVQIYNHRGPAIEREIKRLHEVCIKDHWSHHLIQADVDALVAEGRLMDFTRRPRTPEQVEQLKAQEAAGGSGYWLEGSNGYHPTAEEVNVWSLFGMGHDSINQWVCVEARCKREGAPTQCEICQGHGHYWVEVPYEDLPYLTEGLLKPEQILAITPVDGKVPSSVVEQLCEDWQDYDPPKGPGFQLWSTTSEGEPISPVFESLDALCEWAESNATTFAYNRTSKEEWKRMLDDGLVYHQEGSNVFM